MKKIILALSVLLVSQSAFAYLEEGKTADVRYLQHAGYSQSTLRNIDEMTYQMNIGQNEHYVKYYNNYRPANKWSAFYNKAKIYWDPIQDDYHSGKHEVDLNNSWFPDLHDSSILKPKTNTRESL